MAAETVLHAICSSQASFVVQINPWISSVRGNLKDLGFILFDRV